MKHIFQPTGHSCGPTCIKMILPDESPSIEELIELSSTDWTIGTPPERMEYAFNALNISYKIKSGFQSLKSAVAYRKPCIVRTITDEIPHWIIVYGYYKKEDFWFINDPASGKIEYNSDELERIWKPRDFFYFEIENYIWDELSTSEITVKPFDAEQFELVLDAATKIFRKHMSASELRQYLIAQTDLELSLLAYYKNEIIGFYLIGDYPVPNDISESQLLISMNEYHQILEMNGMEGVALAVLPDYRGLGIGKILIEASFDVATKFHKQFIWGQNYISLNNLKEWLKIRTHFASDNEVHYTLKLL